MSRPQRTSQTQPQPQNSLIGPKKAQNGPPKRKNESYQSIWVYKKNLFGTHTNPKNSTKGLK